MSYNKIYIRNDEIVDITEIHNNLFDLNRLVDYIEDIIKGLHIRYEELEVYEANFIYEDDQLIQLNYKDLIPKQFKKMAFLNVIRNAENLKNENPSQYIKTHLYKGILPFSIIELNCPYNIYFFREDLLPVNYYSLYYNFSDVIYHKIKCLFAEEETQKPNSIFSDVYRPLIVNKKDDNPIIEISNSYMYNGLEKGYKEICNWFKNLIYITEKSSLYELSKSYRIINNEEILRRSVEEVSLEIAKNNNYIEEKGRYLMDCVDSYHSSYMKIPSEKKFIIDEVFDTQHHIEELLKNLKNTDYKIYE